MSSLDLKDFVQSAERLYHERFQSQLERSHVDEFVAIEPISEDYFLGRTLSEAIGKARDAHPDRFAHAMRVGHRQTLHFGVSLS
jgi:hypothetical protein